MKKHFTKPLRLAALLACCLLLAAAPALAQPGLSIAVNQSLYLRQEQPVARVAIANPAIADVTVITPVELLIVAKQAGTTTLYVWPDGGEAKQYIINVQNRDSEAAAAIARAVNTPGVAVEKLGDTILLTGKVDNQLDKNRAETIAGLYGGKVVSLLEMAHPLQIRIEAKILEISTDKVRKLGIQFVNANGKDKTKETVAMGPPGIFHFGQSFSSTRDMGGHVDINAILQALLTTGDAQILSQPSMVTLSGEKANILIGGEIPIPTSNSDGQITVQWREYGIKLHIEPQADAAGMITSKVTAEVSTLDSSSAAAINLNSGLSIPALRSRKAETVIQLSSGGTMVIGGLLNSEEGKQITKIPFLGDLPVLGRFFRSTVTTKEKRELLILVTPTLVDETTPPALSETMRSLLEKHSVPAGGKAAPAQQEQSVVK